MWDEGCRKRTKSLEGDLNDGIGAGNSHSSQFSMSTQAFSHLFISITSFLMWDVKAVCLDK